MDEEFFRKVGERTLELIGYGKELEIELVFVGEKEMQNLNRRWRGKNKVTDVLSFSDIDMPVGELAEKYSLMEILKKKIRVYGKEKIASSEHLLAMTEKKAGNDGENVPELMGGFAEIIISLPYAKKKARRENLTANQELAMLFAHGILHILGYDHERSEEEEKAIWEVQNKILKEFL